MRLALMVCLGLPAFAGEYAVLTSGFRVYADRHERSGDIIRLFAKGGVTELPASMVVEFEQEEATGSTVPESLVEAPPAASPPLLSPREMVREAAVRHGLPPQFVESVARAESAFRPDAISHKGAIGVMQLMPDTARAMSADPHDPAQNIEAGTKLLRELLIKYDGDVVKALSAYNAGPGAVKRFNGLPPYRETMMYVDKVIRDYLRKSGKPAGSP